MTNSKNNTNNTSNKCPFCQIENQKMYPTYDQSKNIQTNTCYLCNLVYNFERRHIGKIFLCLSEFDQNKINNMTWNKFLENKKIPYPNEIDQNVKIIRYSILKFMIHPNKDEFKNFKIFFTNEIFESIKKNDEIIFFTKSKQKYSNIPYDNNFFNIQEYVLNAEELVKLNTYYHNLKINETNEMEKIRKSIDDKINKFEKKINFK